MKTVLVVWVLAAAALLLGPPPADATFHLMQIEQVIGGVDGDTSAQAIQLRMRFPGQGGLSLARLVVRDAAGRNPVVLIDFLSDVLPERRGTRILIASPGFAAHTTPAAVPDFMLTSLIPESYLDAGSLTYETNKGLVLWRLSWGGAAYTGSNGGARFNDQDGNFDPPFDGPLPSTVTQALQFQGGAAAKSTTNADDYELTVGAAVFTNVQGQSFSLGGDATGSRFDIPPGPEIALCVGDGGVEDGEAQRACAPYFFAARSISGPAFCRSSAVITGES